MKINGMREKHVLREATKDVLINSVYEREKHPFSTPPTKLGKDDALLQLYADTFASKALDRSSSRARIGSATATPARP